MTYPNCPIPPWTPSMQALWDKAMFIERTRGAYGVGFPQPGTTYKPPAPGTFLHSLLFVATSTSADVEDHLREVRENMEGWKERVRNSSGKSKLLSVRGIDVNSLEIKI